MTKRRRLHMRSRIRPLQFATERRGFKVALQMKLLKILPRQRQRLIKELKRRLRFSFLLL